MELQAGDLQNSMADSSTTVPDIQIRFAGGSWVRRQLHVGIRYVATRSILMELQAGDLQNSMADSSTTVRAIPVSDCGRLSGLTSATRRYKVHLGRIKTQDFAGFCGMGISSTLAEFYSMGDSSPTVIGIAILIAGGCWVRCQLHAGIRYVPVASIHRISLASVVREHK